ncbi:radical SAM family heme chaperone HemW [Veillonella sp. DNF00869]|uniref:radical SAM family heme chaperone HemW n=1 Tax=Veillonella sp. DNF00869 TaxID=1384081 RepID=UPI000783C8CE|nr:radical SAM family heme chaperone HemW [Veillonella sp. DNF00869]KXB87025.1 putative oxygen-independent coproporphyrinogen III oxidase [Veillonella sp. DNF00869]
MNTTRIPVGHRGMYIHIPFCRQKCTYCDFPSYQGLEDYFDVYTYALRQEIESNQAFLGTEPFDTIYFGGGTPTVLSIKELNRILETVYKTYTVSSDVEITIEANPGEVDAQYMRHLYELGINRISFGVQTFCDDHLRVLQRTHTAKMAQQAVLYAYEVGFRNISIDQIYGLPQQTLEDISYNLDIIQSLPINHISIYGLQVEPSTLLHRQVMDHSVILPSEDICEQMYDYLVEGLEKQMFDRYEIASFGKDGAFSRHNIKYWHGADYIGFGAGAHSFVGNRRFQNTPYVVPYIHKIEMGESPCIEEEIITSPRDYEDFSFLALRTKWGLVPSLFESRFNLDFHNIYGSVVTDLIRKQLLVYEDDAYRLTKEGAKHGNYVFSQFLTS